MSSSTEPKKKKMDTENASDTDEQIGVMVFGHLRITDTETGEILVSKRA